MLVDIPQGKWGGGTGRQVILKGDFDKIETAVVESFDLAYCPDLEYVNAAQVRVNATVDCRARLMMCGFPSPLHRGLFVDGGLSDGKYRENAGSVSLDFTNTATYWGTEKPRQWYCVYAVAGAGEITFALKAMPVMRFASQEAQAITLRNNAHDGNIGYGFLTNELANAKLLVLSGAAKGSIRLITANNNDNETGGTITYSGSNLTMSPGDWFMVLPNTNFRYLGMVYNDAAGNLASFYKVGSRVTWKNPREIFSGALDGWTNIDLGLLVPPVCRLLYGQALAVAGYDVKLAISYDGLSVAELLHCSPPALAFQGFRGALPFTLQIMDGNKVYFTNDNTANQIGHALAWEE